jgi:hypothetical protein
MTVRLSRLGIVALCAALAGAAAPVIAHHSLSVEFDTDRTVTITGVITEMRWSNPHSWLYLDVKDERSQVAKWAIEFASPNSLYRRGWRRSDLPPNLTVTVTGYPNRDKSRTIAATDVKLPDGRTLFAGTAPSEGGR